LRIRSERFVDEFRGVFVMGAEAHTGLSAGALHAARDIEDFDVVEELARVEYSLHEWEAVAPEDLYRAWLLLQHDELLRHAP